ncbi:hypothetical protein DRP04_11065 [Archaeoglobales archaeon]|nr:MAG: hypothetical protein DRP04_11065 [Archaeoglobales archaeon]
MKKKEVEEDVELAEARQKLLRLSQITSFARQTLRASFGLNPLSIRERILLRFQNQKNNQEKLQFQPILLRRPLLERLESLKARFQSKSKEDQLIQEYLKRKKKEELLKQIEEERRKREEEERKRKKQEALERARQLMGVAW